MPVVLVPKPLRPPAPVVIWKGRPYYRNSVEELVQMTDCTCGVAYSPACPVTLHRELQLVEMAELPGVEKLRMTDEQIQARRTAGEAMYGNKKPLKSQKERIIEWARSQLL